MSNQLLLRHRAMMAVNKEETYLRLTAQEDGCTIVLNKVGTPYEAELKYSVNKSRFDTYNYGDTITLDNGDYVRFRRSKSDTSLRFCKDDSNYYQFSITGSVVGSGMLTCLKKANGLVTTILHNDFDKLFSSRIYFDNYVLPYTLTSINGAPTNNCPITCQDLVVPSSLTSLPGCFGTIWWQYLYLPSSITFIERYCFANSSTPIAVYYGGTLEQWLNITYNNPSFDGNNPLIKAHNLYINNQLVTSVVIPQEITSIKNCTFWGGTCVTSVILHNNITSIGINAFNTCNLTSIQLPNNLNSIGANAFKQNHLSSLTIPTSVTSIGEGAFANNTSLNSVYYYGTQADWETIINKEVFNNLYTLYFNDQPLTSVTVLNTTGSSFRKISTITSMDSGTVTKLGSYKFEGCTNLTSVNIREGVTEIGANCFSTCTSLEQVTIPSTVTTMGLRIFAATRNLTLVLLPTTPPSLGIQLFVYASGYKIYVPYSADHSILTAYQTASTWSGYADVIYELNPDGTIPT